MAGKAFLAPARHKQITKIVAPEQGGEKGEKIARDAGDTLRRLQKMPERPGGVAGCPARVPVV